jgi:ferredoxin
MYTPSCKYWVLPPDTVIPLQLRPNKDSNCNRCTIWVANNEYFRLILNYPFSCCNQTVVRVAIDLHSKLQIMCASAWYCTTPSVAIGQWFELQSMYTPICKYWMLPPDTILPLQLQPNNDSNCNQCTLRVANNEYFRLILNYPSVVATRQWFELQSIYTASCK